MNLWDRHKKMTQNDNGPGPGRNYGETAVFYVLLKSVFWPKSTDSELPTFYFGLGQNE